MTNYDRKSLAGLYLALCKIRDRAFEERRLEDYFDLNHASAVIAVMSDDRDGTHFTDLNQKDAA